MCHLSRIQVSERNKRDALLTSLIEVFYNSLFSCQILAEYLAKNSAIVGVEPLTLDTVFLASALYTGQPDALSNCARSISLVRRILLNVISLGAIDLVGLRGVERN